MGIRGAAHVRRTHCRRDPSLEFPAIPSAWRMVWIPADSKWYRDTLAKRSKEEVPAVEQLLLRIERASHPFAALGLGVSQLQAATCAESAHWWSVWDGLAFDVCTDLWGGTWEGNEVRRISKRADMASKGFTASFGQIHCQGGVAVARQALAECEQKLNAAQAWEGFPKSNSALWIIWHFLDLFALRLQFKRSCFGIPSRSPRASG